MSQYCKASAIQWHYLLDGMFLFLLLPAGLGRVCFPVSLPNVALNFYGLLFNRRAQSATQTSTYQCLLYQAMEWKGLLCWFSKEHSLYSWGRKLRVDPSQLMAHLQFLLLALLQTFCLTIYSKNCYFGEEWHGSFYNIQKFLQCRVSNSNL